MEKAINPLFTLSISEFETLVRELILEAFQGLEPKEESERLYSRKEACSMLKISLPTLSRYIALGIIKGHRVGNRILISNEDITNALQEIPRRRLQ